MGYDAKYGRVTTEHGDIPDDEPVIVLRGRDLAVPETLEFYRRRCRALGSPDEHLDLAKDVGAYVKGWQRMHPDRTKVPDSKRYRDRVGTATHDAPSTES